MDISKYFPMSPSEFEKKMNAIADVDDEEVRHAKADNLLCECIRRFSENYEKGLQVFENMKKWYA